MIIKYKPLNGEQRTHCPHKFLHLRNIIIVGSFWCQVCKHYEKGNGFEWVECNFNEEQNSEKVCSRSSI